MKTIKWKAREYLGLAVINIKATTKLNWNKPLTFRMTPMEQPIQDIQAFLLSATPEKCLEVMISTAKDIHAALQPNDLHITLGAHAHEMGKDEWRDLVITQYFKAHSIAAAKLKDLLHIHE